VTSSAPGTRVRVRVPATSANLGPGFDALGLALELSDELEVTVTDGGLHVTPYGGGPRGTVPTGERNLVVRALRAAFAATGGQPPGLSLTYTSTIPHSRGLGSSAAAICAGVGAGLALRGQAPDGELALRLAAELEGHPDNVAPCLVGGATIAWYDHDRARAARLEPHVDLRPVVFVPAVRTSTEQARTALPATVTHRDAAFSAGRAALLVHALVAAPELLYEATQDRLHQQYRLPAAPGSAQLLDELRGAGIAAVLSGSGPTILALCASESEAGHAAALGARVEGLTVSRPAVARRGCTALLL
jgi:homoserine kinase